MSATLVLSPSKDCGRNADITIRTTEMTIKANDKKDEPPQGSGK